MHRFVLLLLLFCLPFIVGQTAAKIPPRIAFPTKQCLERFGRDTHARDGTGERVMHVWLPLASEGAARQFGVLSFSYAAAQENGAHQLVRVHKADGTAVDTPAADAIDMAAAVTREAPLYSDSRKSTYPCALLTPATPWSMKSTSPRQA